MTKSLSPSLLNLKDFDLFGNVKKLFKLKNLDISLSAFEERALKNYLDWATF